MKSKQKIVSVGKYFAGNDKIELCFRSGYGGEFYLWTDNDGLPRIVIGASDIWDGVFDAYIHEIHELLAEKMRLRYLCNADQSQSLDGYYFFYNHNDLCDLCARMAEFIDHSLKDFRKAYKECRKNLC